MSDYKTSDLSRVPAQLKGFMAMAAGLRRGPNYSDWAFCTSVGWRGKPVGLLVFSWLQRNKSYDFERIEPIKAALLQVQDLRYPAQTSAPAC